MSHAGSINAFVDAFNAQPPQRPELREMRLSSMRILNRLQPLLEPVRASYQTPAARIAIRAIVDDHDTIMTQWLEPVRQEDLDNSQKIAAHTDRMAALFDRLLPLYDLWGQPSMRSLISAEILTDGRIVQDRACWNHVLGVPALLVLAQPALAGFLTLQVQAWRRPKLSKWLETAGMPAANGYLRVERLAAFAGMEIPGSATADACRK